MINVCCVRTGSRYSIEYVDKLRNMVARHLPVPHKLICLTDRPETVDDVEFIQLRDVVSAPNLFTGWWGKMALFSINSRGLRDGMIYLDLDTVVVDSLQSLAGLIDKTRFAICRNFTKAAGHPDWPCNYGSCCMVMGPGFGHDIWYWFDRQPDKLIADAKNYGDQWVIERLHDHADYLNDLLPPGYFVGRREFGPTIPEGAAVMVFAGKVKPHTHINQYPWIRTHWR